MADRSTSFSAPHFPLLAAGGAFLAMPARLFAVGQIASAAVAVEAPVVAGVWSWLKRKQRKAAQRDADRYPRPDYREQALEQSDSTSEPWGMGLTRGLAIGRGASW